MTKLAVNGRVAGCCFALAHALDGRGDYARAARMPPREATR